jgi:carboxymethylenebutenolidase
MTSSARKHFLAGLVLAVTTLPNSGVAQTLPPDGESATARLEASPRHGEWVTYDAGDGDEVQAWVSYPTETR